MSPARTIAKLRSAPAPFPQVGTVAELVTFQAAATPDAIALASTKRVWSYREVDERASGLADILRTLGVGPEVVVGLCMPRSPEMVVGALGILKAGGAYLPLDPTYPAAWLTLFVHRGQVPVLVAGNRIKERVTKGMCQAIVLDDLGRVCDFP